MSRKNRLCSDPEFLDEVFSRAEFMTLSMLDKGLPYCIPVNFAREGKIIYIHSAKDGLKLECLAANDNVAFSMAIDIDIDTAAMTTFYKSVCGRGKARLVEDVEEKGHALDLIAARYNAGCQIPSPIANINRVSIIRIDIEEVTGKRHLK